MAVIPLSRITVVITMVINSVHQSGYPGMEKGESPITLQFSAILSLGFSIPRPANLAPIHRQVSIADRGGRAPRV